MISNNDGSTGNTHVVYPLLVMVVMYYMLKWQGWTFHRNCTIQYLVMSLGSIYANKSNNKKQMLAPVQWLP